METEDITDLLSKATMGALFLGAIYHSTLYYFRRSNLLGVYAVYLCCCFLYMSFRVYSGNKVQTDYVHFITNSILLAISFHLYLYFFVIKVFALTPQKNKRVWITYKSVFIVSALYFMAMALHFYLNGRGVTFETILTNILSSYYVLCSCVFILYAGTVKKIGMEQYIFIGAIVLLFFNLAGFLSQFSSEDIMHTHFLNFICLGIFSEIVLFSTAVGLKMKEELMAQVDAEKKILEQQSLLLESENEKKVEVMRAKISERKQISLNMHDELSNALVGLKFYVAHLKKTATTPTEKDLMERVEAEVKDVYEQARIFMHDLHAGRNQQWFDFFDFLKTLSIKFSNTSLTINVEMEEEEVKPSLTKTIDNYLYLITKECLSNIMKYAHASTVLIKVNLIKEKIVLRISDNGVGLANVAKLGLGHKSIKERVQDLKGKVVIQSDQYGTHIDLSIPVAQ